MASKAADRQERIGSNKRVAERSPNKANKSALSFRSVGDVISIFDGHEYLVGSLEWRAEGRYGCRRGEGKPDPASWKGEGDALGSF
jgi:hypothetical protein